MVDISENMVVLDLEQGTDKWLVARLNHLTASEAPAMMNQSKFMSREKLLDIKKGWKANPDSEFKKMLYESGHKAERKARPHAEWSVMDDLPPVVGSRIVDDMLLLASFDGLCSPLAPKVVWEHKYWNEILAENVRNGLLDPLYYWQLEHQLLVSGADYAVFTVSDGTLEKRVQFEYRSKPELREALIKGWKQFEIDLAKHELKAKPEFIPAKRDAGTDLLPAIHFEFEGALINTNLADIIPIVEDKMHAEKGKKLETDQDFADKAAFCKAGDEAIKKLMGYKQTAKEHFVSYANVDELIDQLIDIVKPVVTEGKKDITAEKAKRKDAIINQAEKKLATFVRNLNKKIAPVDINKVEGIKPADFTAACKNKRTLDSITSSAGAEVARVRSDMTDKAEVITTNLKIIEEASADYPELFKDVVFLAIKDTEALETTIELRIREAKDAQEARAQKLKDDLEAEEREEQRKAAERKEQAELDAQREKEQQDREAQEKADRLAEAQNQQQSLAGGFMTDSSDEMQEKQKAKEGQKDDDLVESQHLQGRMVRRKPEQEPQQEPQPEQEVSAGEKWKIHDAWVQSLELDGYQKGWIDGLRTYAYKNTEGDYVVGSGKKSLAEAEVIFLNNAPSGK